MRLLAWALLPIHMDAAFRPSRNAFHVRILWGEIAFDAGILWHIVRCGQRQKSEMQLFADQKQHRNPSAFWHLAFSNCTHTHTQHNQRNVNKCMRVYYEICVTKNLHRMIVVEIEPPTEGGPARYSINIARRCGWQTRAIFWHRQFLSLVWHNRPATMHIIKRHLSWRRDSIGCGRSTHQTRPDTHREDETMKQLCWRSLSQTNFLCINTYCMCFVWCVGSYCVFILYSSRIGLPHFHSNMEIKGFSPVLHYAELALWNEDGRLVSGVLRSVLSRRWSQHIEDIR